MKTEESDKWNRLKDTENKLTVTKGERDGRMSKIVKVIKRKKSQYYWNSIQYFSILFKYYSEKIVLF